MSDVQVVSTDIELTTVVHGIARRGTDRAFTTDPVTFSAEVRNAMVETGPLAVSWTLSGPETLEFTENHGGLQALEGVELSWPNLALKTAGAYAVSLTVSPEDGPAPFAPQATRQFNAVHPLDSLNDAERAELRRETGDRLSRAVAYYLDACEVNKAAAKAAAKDSADFLSLLIEIALGFMLPALAKGISKMAEELPEGASNFQYRVALAALDEERTTKALETGVKVGKEFLKGAIEPLKGEDEIDQFLDSLKTQFGTAVEQIDGRLPSLTDEELGITCAAYSIKVAGPDQFKAAVHDLVEKYKKEVQPIGKEESLWMNRTENWCLARVVFADGGSQLAVLDYISGDPKFSTWVEPELEQLALEKFGSTPEGRYYHGVPPEVKASSIEDVPMVDWAHHLRR